MHTFFHIIRFVRNVKKESYEYFLQSFATGQGNSTSLLPTKPILSNTTPLCRLDVVHAVSIMQTTSSSSYELFVVSIMQEDVRIAYTALAPTFGLQVFS